VQTALPADQHHEHARSRASGRETEQPRPWSRGPSAAPAPTRFGVQETHRAQGGATSPRLSRRHQAADPPDWRATFNVTTCAPPPAQAIRHHARGPSSTSRPWPACRDFGAPVVTLERSSLHEPPPPQIYTPSTTNNTSLHASQPRTVTSHRHASTRLREMPHHRHPHE
jgi:hypothetical protein